ncbi:CvfB family protein [Vaginisenegalia massiliensis]|uniref:CvfB family protein n=1 Tax=Vaginisenegalia massiliensis TaxID=2058294 RepID=UPI000F52D5D2|nr:S1-like domain-containing RNA-binding protein [Vaginisenegalia massiliensis]
MKYGQIITAKMIDQNEDSYFVQNQGLTFAVAKEEFDEALAMGQEVEGMIYENRHHERVMTTQLPDIRPGYYGWAPVVEVRKDLGVFLDVGLKDKEVVLSLDDLPEIHAIWPKKGDQLYVTFNADEQNRLWASLAPIETIQNLFVKAPKDLLNQNIQARVYHSKKVGSLCITSEGYSAFVHQSEYEGDEPRLGEELQARVINVREDGGLNISERPRAHEALEDDAGMILALLTKAPSHFLGLHDKSDPNLIQVQLGISKSQFKRAVGQLMKKKLVQQEKGVGIHLIDGQNADEKEA